MKKFALIGMVAASALMVGCSSTQHREGKCGADCKEACCMTECNHANSTFECSNCEPGKPCCANCAKKTAEMCPDCASNKTAKACPGCADGKQCAKCAA